MSAKVAGSVALTSKSRFFRTRVRASAAANHAATFAKKVLVVDDPRLEHPLAETLAPIIARVAREQGAEVVCATATSVGKDVMPRAAALLGAGMASDIASIADKNKFRRAVLAGEPG